MKITKQYCKDIIDYNTIGKGKGNPNFTALANAKLWLYHLDLFSGNIDHFDLPKMSAIANMPSWRV